MAKGSVWAPLLLCLLQLAQGIQPLAPPKNVTILFRNFRVYLTWCPEPSYPINVTYVVKYQSFENVERWRKVKHCVGIGTKECDLTCLKHQGLYYKFKGRVQAVALGTYSPWAESSMLDYIFDVEPAPPILTWIRNNETLSINATYELPHCVGLMNLKYQVEFWKKGSPHKTRSQATPHEEVVKIPLAPDSTGSYCLSARTIYIITTLKYSQFSQPICFLLENPGTQQRMLALVLPFFLPIIFLPWMFCLKIIYLQPAKMPQSLDFSWSRCPVKTLEPTRPESFGNLFICPKNSLRQGRRPYTESKSSGILQPSEMEDHDSQEESEEGESEDMDDSGTFEPYLGILPLSSLVTPVEESEKNIQSLEPTGSLIHHSRCDSSLVMDTSDSGNVFDSFCQDSGESGTISCLIKDGICRDDLYLPSPVPLNESAIEEESSGNSLSSRISLVPLDTSSLEQVIFLKEPQVSLTTLIITMDRSQEEGDWSMEEEEEEEEDEMGDGNEVESLWSKNHKRTKVTDYQHIDYRLY